jgi:hypothetical protein
MLNSDVTEFTAPRTVNAVLAGSCAALAGSIAILTVPNALPAAAPTFILVPGMTPFVKTAVVRLTGFVATPTALVPALTCFGSWPVAAPSKSLVPRTSNPEVDKTPTIAFPASVASSVPPAVNAAAVNSSKPTPTGEVKNFTALSTPAALWSAKSCKHFLLPVQAAAATSSWPSASIRAKGLFRA